MVKDYYPNQDVLVEDDGSGDSTVRIANNYGDMVITHPFNMGYGVTLQTGCKYADRNRYDFVLQVSVNGQYPAAVWAHSGFIKKNTKRLFVWVR